MLILELELKLAQTIYKKKKSSPIFEQFCLWDQTFLQINFQKAIERKVTPFKANDNTER